MFTFLSFCENLESFGRLLDNQPYSQCTSILFKKSILQIEKDSKWNRQMVKLRFKKDLNVKGFEGILTENQYLVSFPVLTSHKGHLVGPVSRGPPERNVQEM